MAPTRRVLTPSERDELMELIEAAVETSAHRGQAHAPQYTVGEYRAALNASQTAIETVLRWVGDHTDWTVQS